MDAALHLKSSSSANNNKLPLNLPQLQNLIKRDPASYLEEFQRHCLIYEAALGIFNQNPSTFNQELNDLVLFLAQVAFCYSNELKEFPNDLVKLLRSHGPVLHPTQRNGFVRALILLRNKNLLPPTTLLVLFFELLRCPDKTLRKFLEQHIVTDISNINKRCKNNKLNKELQNFMHGMIADNHAVAARTALGVLVQLYDKQVWNDTKTVNLIVEATFSKISKISVAAIKFFVGRDKEEAGDKSSDSDSEDDTPNLRVTLMAQRVGKKTRKKQNHVDKVKAVVKKNRKKAKTKSGFDFSALHLIHDPQSVAERLYRRLETTNERFEVKLMMMNFISRLIGVHRLYLGNFYPLVQRFLFPHQREVTKVMTYAAQAAHPEVPPDDLAPIVKTLANNFVTERCNNEAIAMGLNTIRELCARNHHCMDGDLLEDLADYRTSKDKGIMMAARGLIAVFREKNPSLLRRKDRCAPTEHSVEEGNITEFGAHGAKSYIPGAEVITFTGGEKNSDDESSDDEEDGWEDETMTDEDEEQEEEADGDEDSNSSIPQTGGKAMTRKEAIKEVMKLKPDERKAMAQEIASTRFLTDSDFSKIEAVQAAKQAELWAKGRKTKKRPAEEDAPGESEIVSENSIVMIYKKRKHDKDARMDSIKTGREGREKYGAKTGRMNPFASTTNKEKKKKKAFMMMKHKLRGKQKVSFQTKQARLKASLIKQQKNLIK